jgi:hypothetical protein
MIHKASILPGMSKFIDENILSHYAPTSMKRILMAGAVSLYLKQNENIVDSLTSNPMFTSLGVVKDSGMIDIDTIRDILKEQINKAGFMRLTLPIIGDVDFTSDDIDALYKYIQEANTTVSAVTTPTVAYNGGVY